MDKVLNQTPNGRVFVCPNCEKIHVEFHNFLFSFNQEEYGYFKRCFERMDGCYYESINANVSYRRKIIVPIGHRNASMLLNRKELEELTELLSEQHFPAVGFLSSKQIGLDIAVN